MRSKDFRRLKLGPPVRLTAGLTDHEHPVISPDGRYIAYYAGDYGAIAVCVAAIDGTFARCVSPHGGNNTQPAWHPGGGLVAFRHQHSSDSKWEIWQAALTGDTTPRPVLADPRFHYKHPCFDPAGARMTYFSDEGLDGQSGPFHLWLLELGTGRRLQVSFGYTQMHAHPVFSPDGRRLAYHAYEGTDESRTPAVTNLYELALESGETRQLTFGADQYKHPFYLDDSTLTCHWERNADGVRRLLALDLDALETVELTDGSCNDKHPCPWSGPGGQRLVAWASKKLGAEEPGEPNTYDIFLAELRSGKHKDSRHKQDGKSSKGKQKDRGARPKGRPKK